MKSSFNSWITCSMALCRHFFLVLLFKASNGTPAEELNRETADGSNAHPDLPAVEGATTSIATTLLLNSSVPSNYSVTTSHDDGFLSVLNQPDNKGIVVRSLIVLAIVTVLVVAFFIIKIVRLRLKQRRRRRYDDGDRIEMQRLEDLYDDDDDENDDVEIFDQSSLRRGQNGEANNHRNGSAR